MAWSQNYHRSGQSLVELLVAVAVASTLLPAILTGFVASRSGKVQQAARVSAVALANEGAEALRVVAGRGWEGVSTNGIYHPAIVASSWELLPGAETIQEFTRSITIADQYRDSNGTLVDSGGTIDPSTKRVIITVAWSSLFPSSVTLTRIVTRYHDNAVELETSASQFQQGTSSNVAITNESGGEIVLSAGGESDWCAPNLALFPVIDLPKQGVANAISAIEGRVFAGTGENASGISFANVTLSNSHPPIATVAGTLDGFKTNDVFGETNYAYLATDNNLKEIEIVNLTALPYSEAGYFDAPGNGNGKSVYVVGDIGYMTSADKLYSFNLSTKTGSRPLLDPDGVVLAGVGNSVWVVGSYAYIALDNASTQLQIVDVSNPANLAIVGSASVNGGIGKDVFANTSGTRAYLVTERSSTAPEFFIIDITTKTGTRGFIGTYDTGAMNPKAVTVVPGNRAIIVGTEGQEYQGVIISNESTPVQCGGANVDTGVHGVSSVLESDGDTYSYIITGDTSAELRIIEGGPGGGYATNGTYESATFDAGTSVAFNRFDVSASIPPQTTITYQVAVADAVSGSCNGVSFIFVGPDGTEATRFAAGGAIPISDDGVGYENPGQCFRYRAYLSSDESTQTPVFTDITINYSP
ncbi:hypothetical protein HY410_00420 [Candidatus Gottesmanbacteria bacterium]|nr:hypothetical protein [Candidatus Gottesmanbacteria bacterium]